MSWSRIDRPLRLAAAAMAAALLAGCIESHTDRRQFISLSTGDAVATNKVTHVIDPWPRASGKNAIAYNGEKMQTAVERYRTGRVIPPVNATTSSVAYSAAQQQAQSVSNNQASSAPNNGQIK